MKPFTGLLFRYAIGPVIDFIFFRVYPKIRGEYNVYVYKILTKQHEYELDEDEIEQPYYECNDSIISTACSNNQLLEWLKENSYDGILMKAKIKQVGYKLHGSIYFVVKGNNEDKEAFYGRVTSSRVIILGSESKTEDHHNFGTYLLLLTQNSKHFKGTRSFLCIDCGSADSDYVFFERIN